MGTPSPNPWEATDVDALVSVGTHKLWISTSGPSRESLGDQNVDSATRYPVVIFLTGAGTPAAAYYHLQRLLSRSARVYFYNRSGYDQSERSPASDLSAERAARELYILMVEGIKVQPPYILVGHSYGCIVARTFLELYPDTNVVAGMVLAEAATELSYEMFFCDDIYLREMYPLTEGLDIDKITRMKEESALTDDEWAQMQEAIKRCSKAVGDEDPPASARKLATYQQFANQVLGSRPLSVIRCNIGLEYERVYNYAVKVGHGTEEQRKAAKSWIDRLALYDDQIRGCQLRLSTLNHYVQRTDITHEVPLIKPELIVQEVEWVVKHIHG
jgi:pimeloyl-ACP methyl ester carboxylesterase